MPGYSHQETLLKIHHLNCATLCPPLAKHLINSEGHMVCHCLLIEYDQGLVLVDTGFGLDDIRDPIGRLGLLAKIFINPLFDPKEAAISQVEALGYKKEDVRHIVVTHLDSDHAGGIPDFPGAEIHVFAPEHQAATHPTTLKEKGRYRPAHFAHQPKWKIHQAEGDTWKGFESVRVLESSLPEVLLIPMTGHSRGHCAVGVKNGDDWLLHCGDAYFYRDEKRLPPNCPQTLEQFQKIMAIDGAARKSNQSRIRMLAKEHPEITIFCAHDPAELALQQTKAS
jgi:glyoxylase-like metal-dependent hydrolase (beta-lactamase superfamily II)